jgi:hypothetical protein
MTPKISQKEEPKEKMFCDGCRFNNSHTCEYWGEPIEKATTFCAEKVPKERLHIPQEVPKGYEVPIFEPKGKCNKCGRISNVVELSKNCPFCKPKEKDVWKDFDKEFSTYNEYIVNVLEQGEYHQVLLTTNADKLKSWIKHNFISKQELRDKIRWIIVGWANKKEIRIII